MSDPRPASGGRRDRRDTRQSLVTAVPGDPRRLDAARSQRRAV